ncbi:MAG: hypothetical protein HY911_06745 [Desulfobacterales bacterium]|nr:hypothetical protein [Desulfobacterales bacterium]
MVAVTALILMAGCGGGGSSSSGSSGEVSALALPDRIQLSNVDEAGAARASRSIFRAAARGIYNDTDTDYTNAVKRSWVDDTDALDMINTILGVCNETSYSNFINAGPYKALVRDDDDSQQSQSGNTTTSTTTETLMEIIVDVTRASNTAPMIIKVWLYVNGPNDQPMLVRGYFEVTEGVSEEYPYGAMTAHFKGNMVNEDGDEGLEVMQMALSVSAEEGNVVIENVDDEGIAGGWESHRKVRVVANADVTQGNAYVYDQETEWNEDEGGEFLPPPTVSQIAFNETYFKETEEGQDPAVYAKDDLKHRIYRYKLFDAETGAETRLNSGFPIEFETDSGTKNGYVGYYGLWTNNNLTLASGATVSDMDGNEYTVFRAAGKLTKHTASQMPLGDLTGVELSKWADGTDAIITWDGSSFIEIGYRDQSNGQIVYYPEGDPNIAEVTFTEWDGAWCEPLKSFLRIGTLYAGGATPDNSSTVYFHTEQTLSPSEATDLTLYTWAFTLDMPIDQTVVDQAQDSQNSYWGNESEKSFHFIASEMMLYDAAEENQVSLSGLDIPEGNMLQWGYHLGPLTTEQYFNDQEPYFWEANNAEVYYTWNTGTDQWNQYVTVRDANGNFASFDPPLSFAYTHSTANDANGEATNDGKRFRLEYDGFSLNMPWAYNPESGQWEPQINLADGTQLEDADGNQYVIKGIEECLIMNEVEDPTGITFENEEEVGEPTLTYDSSQTDLVGAVPTDVVLRVIKGEVIE